MDPSKHPQSPTNLLLRDRKSELVRRSPARQTAESYAKKSYATTSTRLHSATACKYR